MPSHNAAMDVALPDVLSQDAVEIVLSGVVAQVERTDTAETVTFDVDGVWKGFVGSRISISRPMLSATGKVTNPMILRSIPALDQAAIECVLKWQFTPTRINGEPKPVRMTSTIAFGMTIPPLSSRPVR